MIRPKLRSVALVAPFIFVGAACTEDATSPPAQPPAGRTSIDAGGRDARAPDVLTPDAGDASDASTEVDASDSGAQEPTTVLPFATGLDANGTPLADGQIDGHFSVKDGTGAALTAYVQTDALGYPGYWLAPSSTSKFISPFSDTVDPSGSGTFTYTTTFSLRAGVDLAAVKLVIRYASDNEMSAITLNEKTITGVTAGSYSSFQSLEVTTDFVVGTNTVAFVVTNSGGPTGMRAELDLTAN